MPEGAENESQLTRLKAAERVSASLTDAPGVMEYLHRFEKPIQGCVRPPSFLCRSEATYIPGGDTRADADAHCSPCGAACSFGGAVSADSNSSRSHRSASGSAEGAGLRAEIRRPRQSRPLRLEWLPKQTRWMAERGRFPSLARTQLFRQFIETYRRLAAQDPQSSEFLTEVIEFGHVVSSVQMRRHYLEDAEATLQAAIAVCQQFVLAHSGVGAQVHQLAEMRRAFLEKIRQKQHEPLTPPTPRAPPAPPPPS